VQPQRPLRGPSRSQIRRLYQVMAFSMLTSLPTELITDILDRLHTRDLAQLSLTSRWSNTVAVPFIWREVELKDRTTDHGSHDGIDQHDDTPLIRKLYILTQYVMVCLRTIVKLLTFPQQPVDRQECSSCNTSLPSASAKYIRRVARLSLHRPDAFMRPSYHKAHSARCSAYGECSYLAHNQRTPSRQRCSRPMLL